MLPDFPEPKSLLHRHLLSWITSRKLELEPVLKLISRLRQHEGEHYRLEREDGSRHDSELETVGKATLLSREEVKNGNVEAVYELANQIAEHFAREEVRTMLRSLGEATKDTPQHLAISGELTQEVYLEMIRRTRIDFDPDSLRPPKSLAFLMSPNCAQQFEARWAEWIRDPRFIAACKSLQIEKLEEWNDRENSRKLAD